MTKRVKRKFSPEFRAEVVKLVTDGGKPTSQVARDHNLGAGLISCWVRQARTDVEEGPAHMLSTAERQELSQVRKDVRELRRENEFLKKTAAWFASQSL
jgi:transposase